MKPKFIELSAYCRYNNKPGECYIQTIAVREDIAKDNEKINKLERELNQENKFEGFVIIVTDTYYDSNYQYRLCFIRAIWG